MARGIETMLHLASTLVLVLIAAGLWARKVNPRWHRAFMVSAFVSDLLLVLYIEFTRHAVEKVAARVQPILWFHSAVSVAVLCCYVAMIRLGRPMLAGNYENRATHRKLGMIFVVLRTVNYVTSYMLA
jgi:uncharacterized membrane protein YozB (DUF420 family)